MEQINYLTILTMVRCVLVGIYLAVGFRYIFYNGKHERGGYILGVLLITWGLEIAKEAVWPFTPSLHTTLMRNTYFLIDMLVIPLCTFFIMEQIYAKWIFPKRILLHMFPFVFWPIAYYCTESDEVFDLALIFACIYCFFMLIKYIHDLRIYHKEMGETYSFKDKIDLKWLGFTLVMLVLYLVFSILIYCDIDSSFYYFYYPYCLFMWLFVSYHVDRQKRVMILELIEERNPEKKTVEITPKAESKLSKQLTELFEKKKIYLNAQLSIYDVAKELGTNRTYISNCINNNLQTNFYDFVNAYRLDVAKKLLDESDEKVSVIAYNSGFNCFSTFLRTFRKKYGCTPQEYRNNL